MRMASGKVVGGRVELDGELPEGATVTVIAVCAVGLAEGSVGRAEGPRTGSVNFETPLMQSVF